MKWDSEHVIDGGCTNAKCKNHLHCSYTVISEAVKQRNVSNFDVG